MTFRLAFSFILLTFLLALLFMFEIHGAALYESNAQAPQSWKLEQETSDYEALEEAERNSFQIENQAEKAIKAGFSLTRQKAAKEPEGSALEGSWQDIPIIAMTNGGNIDFAQNWLRSLERNGVKNWKILVTDDAAWGGLRAWEERLIRIDAALLRQHGLRGEGGEKVEFLTEGWSKLMMMIPQLMRWLLREKVSIFEFIQVTDLSV